MTLSLPFSPCSFFSHTEGSPLKRLEVKNLFSLFLMAPAHYLNLSPPHIIIAAKTYIHGWASTSKDTNDLIWPVISEYGIFSICQEATQFVCKCLWATVTFHMGSSIYNQLHGFISDPCIKHMNILKVVDRMSPMELIWLAGSGWGNRVVAIFYVYYESLHHGALQFIPLPIFWSQYYSDGSYTRSITTTTTSDLVFFFRWACLLAPKNFYSKP